MVKALASLGRVHCFSEANARKSGPSWSSLVLLEETKKTHESKQCTNARRVDARAMATSMARADLCGGDTVG
eukprot:2024614-Pyramimonas_sp.AAC.1